MSGAGPGRPGQPVGQGPDRRPHLVGPQHRERQLRRAELGGVPLRFVGAPPQQAAPLVDRLQPTISRPGPGPVAYRIRNRRRVSHARASSAVRSGSGLAAASPGFWASTRRTASAGPAAVAGSTRTIFASAVAAGCSDSAEPCQPCRTAITSPRASAVLNISGGTRAPRPSR